MKSVYPALFVALLVGLPGELSASPARQSTGSPVLVNLTVNSGRAILVTDQGVNSVTQQRSLEPFVGSGHLEVAPGSLATLSWRGLGSFELEGPAALSWQLQQSAGGLLVNVNVLNRIDIEVRKLPMQLQLPGQWRGKLDFGAYSIYAAGNGGNEFVHRAGHPVRLSWMGGPTVTAPVVLTPGAAFRMDVDPKVEIHGSRDLQVPSWGQASWPWGDGGIEGLPDITLHGAPSWGDGEAWPWSEEQPGAQAPSSVEVAELPPAEIQDPRPWEKWDWPWQAQAPEAEKAQTAPLEVKPVQEPAAAPTESNSNPVSMGVTDLPQGHVRKEAAPPIASQPEPVPLLPKAGPGVQPTQSLTGDSDVAPGRPSEPASTQAEDQFSEREVLPRGPTVGSDPPAAPQKAPAKGEASRGEKEARSTAKKDKTTSARFNSEVWRGLPEDLIVDKGVFRHQDGPHFRAEPNGEGGWMIFIEQAATKPYWFFSRRLDVRIFPGATLEIDRNGYLGHSTGLVRILSGHNARVF